MSPILKLEALKYQLASHLESFEKKRVNNKKKAFFIYLSVTAISALVTVLLGLQGMSNGEIIWIRNIALILSATVTVLSGFDSFFNHRSLWVQYTQTFTELRGLQSRLHYLTATQEVLLDDEVDQLFDEMQKILLVTNKWWQDQRAEEPIGSKQAHQTLKSKQGKTSRP